MWATRCYDALQGLWCADLSLELLRSEIAFQADILGRSPIEPGTIAAEQFAAIR